MIKIESITVGTDAEVPIFLKTGPAIPVTGFVGGTKKNPRPLKGLPEGFALQEDNVNLEFNIAPAKTASMLEKHITKVLIAINGELPPSLTWQIAAATEYDPKFLNNPEAMTFGCDPDFNVYTGDENPKPRSKNPNLRTAAAHVHVGWEGPINEDRRRMVKMMDLTIGLSFAGKENKVRKELYGKAGAYRPKSYGVEYRSPSNMWINQYAQHMFNQVILAAKYVNEGVELTPKEEAALIETINTCTHTEASLKLAGKHGVYVL